ncbi:hypothetical protein Phum_PHUM030020 [Pediculus humanus corporis]|uniref:Uncharacterized protein n=1 Tax=Pediculus humanus subsp. corporis TaxID=121224 RepID=E0VA82_PEDHC|nr:uncharacterized protein Phum_PHUM030020 [Pediculus humanus corporis]EEB10288.1 hypothetical protein Phum_PHUM030020 [Pediculus humanus corporis]
MALEDRCSPSSASTPGPKASSDRPGSDGNAVRVTSPPTPSSVKDNDNRQTKFDEGYELKRKIKMEPDVEVDNYEEKKIRIWRKISDEEHDDSKSSNSDLEKRLSPGGYVKTTSFSPEIIQRFSSYSIERFVNSDIGRCGGGENSSGNGIIQSNGQYPMDVNNGNYLNVPLFMSKTHKNVTMLNSSHQKVSRTPENDILKPDFGSKYIQKNCEIWNPLKRTVTPIIRTSDELRKPNRTVQNRTNRSFDIARLTETDSVKNSSQEEYGKRRHSDAVPIEPPKLQERRKTTESDVPRLLPEVTKESPTRIPLPSPAASSSSEGDQSIGGKGTELWPAWVYCTRYSDRPSSGNFYKKESLMTF